jgi:type II secretory pathway component PulC
MTAEPPATEPRRSPVLISGIIAIFAALVAGGAFLLRPQYDGPDTTGSQALAVARRVSEFYWVVPKKQREEYFADVAKAARQVTLNPISDGSKDGISRLVVSQVAQPGPVHDAGFLKEDVIVQVNGTPVATMARALNLIHEIRSSDRLTVRIRRGERIIDFRFDFQ